MIKELKISNWFFVAQTTSKKHNKKLRNKNTNQ